LSIAFLMVSLIFLTAPNLFLQFGHLEIRINDLLHIKQT